MNAMITRNGNFRINNSDHCSLTIDVKVGNVISRRLKKPLHFTTTGSSIHATSENTTGTFYGKRPYYTLKTFFTLRIESKQILDGDAKADLVLQFESYALVLLCASSQFAYHYWLSQELKEFSEIMNRLSRNPMVYRSIKERIGAVSDIVKILMAFKEPFSKVKVLSQDTLYLNSTRFTDI